MRYNRDIQSLKIAATFLGTIIGAGFATGQEILKFFTIYGFDGYIGIIIATILFVIIGIIILNISYVSGKSSYHEFFNYALGKRLGFLGDVLITIFLLGIFNVMLSACGALFNEHFGLPYYFGIIFTLVPVIIVVIKGIKSILNVNFIIAPIIIIIIIVISIYSILTHSNSSIIRNLYYESSYQWLLSSLMYVSYNIILSSPILVPLAKNSNSKRVLFKGMILGGIVVGVLILLINTVLINNLEENVQFQIPLLHVVQPFSDTIKYLFISVLWLGIFTTILSSLFGLSYRIEDALKISHKKVVFGVGLLSIFISRFDFKTLLSILYPIFGFVSLLFILVLLTKQLYYKLKEKIIFIGPKNKNK